MKSKPAQFMSFLGCAVMLQCVPALADDYGSTFIISTSVDITSGTYGGTEDTDDTYSP